MLILNLVTFFSSMDSKLVESALKFGGYWSVIPSTNNWKRDISTYGLFPLAFTIVEFECEATWLWFLQNMQLVFEGWLEGCVHILLR